VVVDCDDLPATVRCTGIASLAAYLPVVVVTGVQTIEAEWLSLSRRRPLTVVTCDLSARANGWTPAVLEVSRLLGAPSPALLTESIIERVPCLATVPELVGVVCRDPWGVRRPHHLAERLAVGQPHIISQAKAAGFSRVEHVIALVRRAMYDVLVDQFRFSGSVARSMSGIADSSNLLKAVRRAQRRALASLVLAVSAGFFAACRGSDAGGAEQAQAASADGRRADSTVALPVVGALVRRGDLVLKVRATGAVRADRLVNLKSETQGTVVEVPVRPGDHVAAGQLLVRLDPRPLDLAIREAEAAVAEARMRLQDALLGDSPGDSSIISMQRRENARLRSGIVAAEARLERAQLERQRAEISAPFAGVLDAVSVVPGQHLGPGDAVARIVDLSTLTIEAAVLEHDLLLIHAGGAATVSPSANAGTRLRGTIVAVLPIVDTTSRSGRALVRVSGGSGALRPGMYADVELEATRLTNRVLVPSAAVIERDGRPLVFRAWRGRAEWVYLTPGRSNGEQTEVLSDSIAGRPAVSPGDTVLVGGHLTLTHDAPIRLQVLTRRH
jgi:membrane fusion protein (multidrug efflux system)